MAYLKQIGYDIKTRDEAVQAVFTLTGYTLEDENLPHIAALLETRVIGRIPIETPAQANLVASDATPASVPSTPQVDQPVVVPHEGTKAEIAQNVAQAVNTVAGGDGSRLPGAGGGQGVETTHPVHNMQAYQGTANTPIMPGSQIKGAELGPITTQAELNAAFAQDEGIQYVPEQQDQYVNPGGVEDII